MHLHVNRRRRRHAHRRHRPLPRTRSRDAPGSPELNALAAEARGHYDRAVQAQRQGDWSTYGEELKQLGAVLDKMRAR